MANRKGSDTGNLDFPSTTEAHHNEKGMYVMNDPESAELPPDGMVKDETSGLFVPAPKDFKHYRFIQTEKGLRVEVEATPDEIKEAIFAAKALDAPDWFAFTDPTFGLTTWLHREALVSTVAIGEDFKDLDLIREQQEEYMKSKARRALDKAVPQNNARDQENNRRLLQKIQRGH